MVLHNPNNWHWVNKDASAWTQDWLHENLVEPQDATVLSDDSAVTARLTKVVSLDGDVDVSQRKGKVITIYDFKLVLEYDGTILASGADDDDDKTESKMQVSGTITIPEVAHDTAEDEFVFDIDVYSDAKEKQPVKDLVRAKLLPRLRKDLLKLPAALIEAHGKDIQHGPDYDPSRGFAAAPKYGGSGSSDAASAATSTTTQTTISKTGTATTQANVNTTTVTASEEFRTSAEELFQTFTDPARLAAFTRSPPKVFEGAHVGGKFELFGGNVSGAYVVLDSPVTIEQSWRLNQWPVGHFSNLRIEFDQNDVDHVTIMRVTWTGVPVGQEDVTKRNWSEYYVRSIKTTFG